MHTICVAMLYTMPRARANRASPPHFAQHEPQAIKEDETARERCSACNGRAPGGRLLLLDGVRQLE